MGWCLNSTHSVWIQLVYPPVRLFLYCCCPQGICHLTLLFRAEDHLNGCHAADGRTHDTQGARSSSGSVGERKYSTTFLMKQCIFVFDCFERWIYSEGFILNCAKIWNLRRLAYQTVENMHSCIFCAAMGEKNHYMLYFRRLSEISLNYSCCIKKSEACLLEWMFKLRSKSLYYWIHVKWKKHQFFY